MWKYSNMHHFFWKSAMESDILGCNNPQKSPWGPGGIDKNMKHAYIKWIRVNARDCFSKMPGPFSRELVAPFKKAIIDMCWEFFSEEFLCLDKLTSCEKVGHCMRLCDCMLFPYDAIQQQNKTNEKPAWPLRVLNLPTYILKKDINIYKHAAERRLSTNTSNRTWLSELKNPQRSRGLEAFSPWITADKITANKSLRRKGFWVEFVWLYTWLRTSYN